MKEKLFSITKKDFDIQTFCSGGPGGQHQNKTASGVRIIHKASGAIGESRTHRSQHQNKREALTRLTNTAKFKLWLTRAVYEACGGKSIEQKVDEALVNHNIKLEVKNESGKWEEKDVL